MRVSGPQINSSNLLRLGGRESSMRHSIDDVIHPHAEGHRSEGLRIVWVVGPLPRVTEVHVVTDGDDDATLVVANGSPLRLITVLLIGPASPHVLFARYLHL